MPDFNWKEQPVSIVIRKEMKPKLFQVESLPSVKNMRCLFTCDQVVSYRPYRRGKNRCRVCGAKKVVDKPTKKVGK